MPKFLSREEIYDLIEREMPESVFAYSASPSKFLTTSDDDAMAKTLESAYLNLSKIYSNYFPQDSVEKLSDWEITVFGQVDDSGATLAERAQRILTKIRSRKGITNQDIKDIVYTIIGNDKNVEIIEKGCESGSWRLNRSRLSRNTFLGISSSSAVSIPANFDPCADDAATVLGITQEELEKLQTQAYSYDVRIIGYSATAEEIAKMDAELTKFEPARSKHKIISPFISPVIKEKWKLSRSKLNSRTYLS